MVFSKRRRVEDEHADSGPFSRPRDSESPKKRTRRESASFPQTPAASGSSRTPSKCTFATPRTPYTPYPLHASDSPSNPFGRKRKERLVHSLPPRSSFSKHIALRFQLVRQGLSPRFGGVHRIVRVPMNYTFTHVRSLISWLFETPAKYSNGKAGEEEYLFEIKSKALVFSPLYKPGQLKTGTTTVKLSNVRDPGRWPSENGFRSMDDELAEDEGDVDSRSGTEDEEEDDSEDWEWMDEEEYTLGHAWPRGIDPEIGVVYHHSSSTQVHITVNNVKLPRQRGISNAPYVFTAKGRVHLSPLPLARPNLSTSLFSDSSPLRCKSKDKGVARFKNPAPCRFPTKSTLAPRVLDEQLTDMDADGDTDQEHEDEETNQTFDSNHPFFRSPPASPSKNVRREKTVILVEDSDEEESSEENPGLVIDPVRWNEPSHAFALYLLQFMDPLGMSFDDIDESFFQEEIVYDPFDNDEPENVAEHPVALDEEEEEDSEAEESDGNEEAEEYGEEEEEEFTSAIHRHALGSTPGLTHGESSASSLPPSSPGRASSPDMFSLANSSSMSLPDDFGIVLEEHYPNKKYSQTPAPPKARRHRLRIKRIEKRLERIKKADFLCVHDEGRETSSSKKNSKKNSKRVEIEEGEEDVKWTKPVLKEGEIWDPFGDEPEV